MPTRYYYVRALNAAGLLDSTSNDGRHFHQTFNIPINPSLVYPSTYTGHTTLKNWNVRKLNT